VSPQRQSIPGAAVEKAACFLFIDSAPKRRNLPWGMNCPGSSNRSCRFSSQERAQITTLSSENCF